MHVISGKKMCKKTRNTRRTIRPAVSGLFVRFGKTNHSRLSTATREEPIIKIARNTQSALTQNFFLSFCFCVAIFFLPFLPPRILSWNKLSRLPRLIGVDGPGQLIRAGSAAPALDAPQRFLYFVGFAADHHFGQALGVS